MDFLKKRNCMQLMIMFPGVDCWDTAGGWRFRNLCQKIWGREFVQKMGRKKIQISRITDERNRQVIMILMMILVMAVVNAVMMIETWAEEVLTDEENFKIFKKIQNF